jgi:hypothetical protein
MRKYKERKVIERDLYTGRKARKKDNYWRGKQEKEKRKREK